MSSSKKSGKSTYNTVKDIKQGCQAFLNDRKNANNIIDLSSAAEAENVDIIRACILAMNKIFTTLLSSNEMQLDKQPAADPENVTKEERLKGWYTARYNEARGKLLEFVLHEDPNVQELALCGLMKLVKAEGHSPLVKATEKNIWFPIAFFQKIMIQLLSSESDMTSLIVRFQEFLAFDDVRYYTMKTALSLLKGEVQEESTEAASVLLNNTFSMLENLSMPDSSADKETLKNFLSRVPESPGLKINTLKEHKKLFSSVWLEFLKIKLPVSLYKRALVILHDKVIPHLVNPRLLADFLTASYDIGGAISLLALNGVFILVSQYNLDYPDFYKKLYALFDPTVFHAKYRARFFYLVDLFLSSTHIPAYLVAAFIKRLARLSLTAPPSGSTVIIPLIYNLLRRHPNCEVLVNTPEGPTDLSEDPYNMEEPDPARCNALKSSLWELKALQQHYHHTVSKDASLMDKPLGFMETDISDLLETTADDLIQKERTKKLKTGVACTYEEPKGLFGNKEDQLGAFWAWRD